MSNIPAAEIIANRLCLVCARDGVAKPVQKHEWGDTHFDATFSALAGEWVRFSDDDPEQLEIWDCAFGIWTFPSLCEGRLVDDYWRMACEVGGLVEIEVPSSRVDERLLRILVYRHEDMVMKMWRVPKFSITKLTPKEAVQRAYMEQLWDNAKGANHES